MSGSFGSRRFAVWETGADGVRSQMGRILVDDDWMVTVLAVSGPHAGVLRGAVADFNAADSVYVRQPPNDPDRPLAVRKREVGRDEPDFVEAMLENLERVYGLETEEQV